MDKPYHWDGGQPPTNEKMEMITITMEEYNDFCMIRDFVYDNNYVMALEMYIDIKNNQSQVEETINLIIEDEEE